MNRRHAVIGGVGAAAGAAGLGWKLWSEGQQVDVGDFWTRRFPQPAGGEVVMAEWRGQPFVVNFWATWCPPCLREMPEIERFHQAHAPKGWRVLGLAVDRPEPVKDFMARKGVTFTVGLAGFEGTELSRQLGNEKGLLPFTAMFDRKGRVVHRKLGETTLAELSAWASGI